MRDNHVELLAPAGNTEGFYGAIHAGADAVYLGGSRFGARAYADNFTADELIHCIRYAHLWGRRVYLTVNTLVKEREFSLLYDYLLPFYEIGLDGVIVQDIGVLAFLREHFPEMELHASTQMTLTGVYGSQLVRDMGVCRIVPARELSLEEIKHIKEHTGLSLETFIHGAMCYCYSGQCLFSSILGGRSGNRGRCAQPCRLPYEVLVQGEASKECYPLSLKDMCTIEHIPELIEAGIDSFKIEGRMKKPEYTAGVTAIYRKYIDQYYEAEACGEVPKRLQIAAEDSRALSCLYIRSERQDGYYYKHNGRDMVTLDSPAYSGSDDSLLARIRRDYIEIKPKLPVTVSAEFIVGRKAVVTFSLGELSATCEGELVEEASKQPISEDNIQKQLNKLGDSSFAAEEFRIHFSPNAFYPLRAINELRRAAVASLENLLIEHNGFPIRRSTAVLPAEEGTCGNVPAASSAKGRLGVLVRRMEQLLAVYKRICGQPDSAGVKRITIDSDLLLHDREEVVKLCEKLSLSCEILVALPYILRRKDEKETEGKVLSVFWEYPKLFSGVLVRSSEGIGILKKNGFSGRIYTDSGFYIWNKRTLKEWKDTISGFCMPLELKSGEQRELLGEDVECEKIVYGRIPMMITANCIANTTTGCIKQAGGLMAELRDRYHKSFPVELNCTHCINIIYNSVPLSLHKELGRWMSQVDFRLDFTTETKRETEEVMEYFTGLAACGYRENPEPPYRDYTTGHEKRGVE